MKPFIFLAALVLVLSACDNTKLQLRAPQQNKTGEPAATAKADTIKLDTVKAVAVKH